MSGLVSSYPQPQKLGLADFDALNIYCHDCGHSHRAGPAALADFMSKGLHCEMTLRPKLVCSVCRRLGRPGRNLDLIPTFRWRAD